MEFTAERTLLVMLVLARHAVLPSDSRTSFSSCVLQTERCRLVWEVESSTWPFSDVIFMGTAVTVLWWMRSWWRADPGWNSRLKRNWNKFDAAGVLECKKLLTKVKLVAEEAWTSVAAHVINRLPIDYSADVLCIHMWQYLAAKFCLCVWTI